MKPTITYNIKTSSTPTLGYAPYFYLATFLILTCSSPCYAAYIKRYSTVANGGMTYTGNTLGLSYGANGSIGAFITTNGSLTAPGYPAGTTLLWAQNSSSALLRIPAGSTILYAELIWGGNFWTSTQDVYNYINNSVSLSGPGGSFSVAPSVSTAARTPGDNYYVRSADVTSIVQAGGAGTYTVGGVPATVAGGEYNNNAAGWTLAVIYGNPALPARNMTVFVGAELTSTTVAATSSVSGFCTPASGTINARMMVSAIEGDSGITGDSMMFGPSIASLAAVSGPNNQTTNFFSSQINDDSGARDTTGTFGTLNSTSGSQSSNVRTGWDITNVDVSTRMTGNQTMAYARGTTSGDRYTLSSIGLQINVGSPSFSSSTLTVDKAQTYVGDVLTYTAVINNSTGTANSLNTTYSTTLPVGTSFVSGSFKLGGVVQSGADPVAGVNIGTINTGSSTTVSYQLQVNALPTYPSTASFTGQGVWNYQYQSCAGFPVNNGTINTNTATTNAVRIIPAKSATPSGGGQGTTVTYTITIPNNGTADSNGTTLSDPIPANTSYVAGSTTINGSAVADVGGAMPFATTRLVNSPTGAAGQVKAGETATVTFKVVFNISGIITNIATIDPDGAGPIAAITVPLTNPPVTADLAVAITNNQTSLVAGTAVSYLVTVTNVSSSATMDNFKLSIPLPASITVPAYTPSAGTYNVSTGGWTGLSLASGGSVTLTINGTVSPSATGTVTVPATVTVPLGIQEVVTANNSASDSDPLTYQADLGVTLTDGKTSINPGAVNTYTIVVTNNGPSSVASLTLTDTIPSLFTNPAFTPTQGMYNEMTGLWTGLNLQPGQSATLTLKGTVDVKASGSLVNTVTVSPPGGVTDPISANNTASDTDSSSPLIDLVLSADVTTAKPGAEITYTIYYHNIGGSAASSLVIMDTAPLNTTYLPGSMKLGNSASTYATATALTDSADADAGTYSSTSISFTINNVAADDGIANSGNDEGKAYFKVRVN